VVEGALFAAVERQLIITASWTRHRPFAGRRTGGEEVAVDAVSPAVCFCICAQTMGLIPPNPDVLGWHILQPSAIFTQTREKDIFDHPDPERWF
jgi:hypothetical protein